MPESARLLTDFYERRLSAGERSAFDERYRNAMLHVHGSPRFDLDPDGRHRRIVQLQGQAQRIVSAHHVVLKLLNKLVNRADDAPIGGSGELQRLHGG